MSKPQRLSKFRRSREAGGFAFVVRLMAQTTRALRLSVDQGLPRGVGIGPQPRIIGARYITIGHNFSAGARLRVECIDHHLDAMYSPRLMIGDRVAVGDDVHIGCAELVKIGHDVLLGSRVLIIDHNHGDYGTAAADPPTVPPQRRHLSVSPVHIGDRVWLGEQAIVLPGSSIGNGCVVGAGAVVAGTHRRNLILVGSPARPVREWDEIRQQWLLLQEPPGV